MSKLTLILGGARSGKSTYGEQLAQELADDVLFVATAQAWDEDMRHRISRHQEDRPSHWRTLESPTNFADIGNDPAPVVLVDCMTLLVSNLLMQNENMDGDTLDLAVRTELDSLAEQMAGANKQWIIISNEVGLGIVPDNRLARLYRDSLGRANQRLAKTADKVIFLVAGIPMVVKDATIE